MKYAGFSYDTKSLNIGDQIQSIAAEQYLPRVDRRFERDGLDRVSGEGERHLTIMNGWFSHRPEHWPPGDGIVPVFFGFHVTPWARSYFTSDRARDYFRTWGPVGCRDRGTRDMLASHGIDAFQSYCLTLTLPIRDRAPANGKTFLVDCDRVPVPAAIEKSAIHCTHFASDILGEQGKRQLALDHLEAYRSEARLVITTRLHCALPCVAMGIPVVYFGDPDNPRTAVAADIGLTTHRLPAARTSANRLRRAAGRIGRVVGSVRPSGGDTDGIDWSPKALDVEATKSQMRSKLTGMIEAVTERVMSVA